MNIFFLPVIHAQALCLLDRWPSWREVTALFLIQGTHFATVRYSA